MRTGKNVFIYARPLVSSRNPCSYSPACKESYLLLKNLAENCGRNKSHVSVLNEVSLVVRFGIVMKILRFLASRFYGFFRSLPSGPLVADSSFLLAILTKIASFMTRVFGHSEAFRSIARESRCTMNEV